MRRGVLRKVFAALGIHWTFLTGSYSGVLLIKRSSLIVKTVCCLVRFASQSAVWFIAALGNRSGISDSILHKHKCTFFFPRQAVHMVAVIGTSEARPRGDPENGLESEVGALHRTYLISTDSS